MSKNKPKRLTRQQAELGRSVLEEMRAEASLEGANVMSMFLDRWKKEQCEALGHPLELREGYALFCPCGACFGAVSPEEAEREE